MSNKANKANKDENDLTMVDDQVDNVEMVDVPEDEPKKKGKKKLICRLKVVENSGTFKAGTEYTGKNAKHLLKRKAIYEA